MEFLGEYWWAFLILAVGLILSGGFLGAKYLNSKRDDDDFVAVWAGIVATLGIMSLCTALIGAGKAAFGG